MSNSYRLTYFDGRGLAETSRYLLTLGGANWEDKRLSIVFKPDGPPERPEFDELKASGALPFGQVPILEILEGGQKLAQSKAIERYLARTFNLYGANNLEAARIDSFSEGLSDLRTEYSKASYWAKPEEKDALLATFTETTVPKHLALLENNVVETTDLHLGDVQFAASWEALTHNPATKLTDAYLDAYPKLKARHTLFTSNEKIAAYLAARKATPF